MLVHLVVCLIFLCPLVSGHSVFLVHLLGSHSEEVRSLTMGLIAVREYETRDQAYAFRIQALSAYVKRMSGLSTHELILGRKRSEPEPTD